MILRLRRLGLTLVALPATFGVVSVGSGQDSTVGWHRRMDRLEADIVLAEDMRAIKRLQRACSR